METKTIKILAIDDNQDNLVTLKALINESFKNVKVFTALSGKIGLEIAALENPDVILLDILMPEMDGYEVCQKLKADNNLKEIPVVFITALKGDKATRIKALEAGAEAFLAKPIDESELIAQVKAMVKIKEANIEKINRENILLELVAQKTKDLEGLNKKALSLIDDLFKENEARKISEQAVIESEDKYSKAFQTAPYAITITSLSEGIFIDVNESFCHTTGYLKEDIIGSSVEKINIWYNGDDRNLIIHNLIENQKIENQLGNFRKKNGEKIIGLFSAQLIEINGSQHILASINDITEKKLAEEELNKTKKQYQDLITKISVGVYVLRTNSNGENIFEFISPQMARIFNCLSNDIIENPQLVYNAIAPEDLIDFVKGKNDSLSNISILKWTGRLLIDGKTKWVNISSVPELQTNGDVLWHGLISDITEQKLSEELLLRNSKLLEESQVIAKVGGWELDLILNKLYWTAETYKIHETSPEEFNPTVDAGVGYFLPESKRIISDALDQAMKYGIGYDLYLETYTTKGNIINVRTTCDVTLENGIPIKLTGIFQDITDIKQAEKALLIAKEKAEESENKLKVMVNAMPDLVWFKSQDGVYLECNERFENFIGFSQENLIGKTDYDLFDKDLADFFRKHDQMAMAAGKSTINEERITFINDGHQEDLETIKTPIYDSGKNIIGVLGIGRNITERKQAEILLKEKEERHRAITQTANDGIITSNSSGVITGWNKAAEKIFGYTDTEIIGKPLTVIIPPHFKVLHEEGIKRFESNGEKRVIGKTVELEGFHKNGIVFPIELSLAEWETGTGKFVTGFIKDITEKKKAELELEKNLSTVRKLSVAINQSPVTTVITDLEGKIIFVNPKFTDVTGYTFEEAIGQNPRVLNSGHTPKEEYKELWETILSGKSWHGVFQNKKKNGDLFWEKAVISPVKNEQGIITNFLAVKEDITEKRIAELALIESNERYDLVAKATNDSIWDLNILTHEIVRSGGGFEKLFGYEATAGNIDYSNYRNLIHPDDLDRVIASKTKVFSNPDEFNWEQDYRFLKANGEYAFVHDKGFIIRDEKGKAIRMIGATQDVTEREKHIKAIEEQNSKLRDIAWLQSHVVRAPLARMMGIVNLLNETELNSEEFNKWVDHFNHSSAELDQVILDIAKKSAAIDLKPKQ